MRIPSAEGWVLYEGPARGGRLHRRPSLGNAENALRILGRGWGFIAVIT
jgi:hypothetical protein